MSAIPLSHLLLLLGVRRKKKPKSQQTDKQSWHFKCQGVIAKGSLVKGKVKQ